MKEGILQSGKTCIDLCPMIQGTGTCVSCSNACHSVLIVRETGTSLSALFKSREKLLVATPNSEAYSEWKTNQYVSKLASTYYKTSAFPNPTLLYNYTILLCAYKIILTKNKCSLRFF